MKNKILAFTAFALLAGSIAFATSQSGSACCDMQNSTCNGVPCPSPDACPVPCCEADNAAK